MNAHKVTRPEYDYFGQFQILRLVRTSGTQGKMVNFKFRSKMPFEDHEDFGPLQIGTATLHPGYSYQSWRPYVTARMSENSFPAFFCSYLS